MESNSPRPVKDYFVNISSTIGDAIAAIDRSSKVSIALLVDDQDRLINTISDGDVRRGLLAGLRLDDLVSQLMPIKARTPHPVPVTAPVETDRALLLEMMQESGVRQIPLLDESARVTDIVILADLLPQAMRPLQAVVMAGGEGTRLRPLTESLPKPMLPIGGKPLMEHIVNRLRDIGVSRINVATHYQADKIIQHFGDGGSFGVSISYLREHAPLGTGGALALLEKPCEPTLVINGDILTDVDFRTMYVYHQDHSADLTVAVRRYDMQVPYGVIECEETSVLALKEKPQFTFFVNAGIYLVEPDVFDLIPQNEHFNMTDLISRLLADRKRVISFPICEYWLDIGQHEHYVQAQEDILSGKLPKRGSLD